MRFTIRVNVPEMPPGHAAVPAASVPSKRRVQNRFPVSLSTAKTWLEGAPIIESGVIREFPHIAPLAGWYEYAGRLIDATLGMLQEFLSGARDGWELCLDDARGLRRATARASAR